MRGCQRAASGLLPHGAAEHHLRGLILYTGA